MRREAARRRARILVAMGIAVSLPACGARASANPAEAGAARGEAGRSPDSGPGSLGGRESSDHPGGTVAVLYAGSLVNLMEHDLGPAFQRRTGYRFFGYPAGSRALANQISGKLRRGDVFISASAGVDEDLMGEAHGDWVRWYATFATAPLVVGYNPESRFAADFKSQPWYEVLAEPGIRIGRTDPRLDPKGARTIQLLRRAERVYRKPGLARRVLGADENPDQVFPETDLVGRLQAGQLDAAFFYANEATELGMPVVEPAAAVDPAATYTVTVLERGPDSRGAEAFVAFLLGPPGRAILERHGLSLVRPRISGDASAIPARLRPLVGR